VAISLTIKYCNNTSSFSVLLHNVEFSTAPPQNGLSTYKLCFHKKTNISEMTKTLEFIIAFKFDHRAVLKEDHSMTHCSIMQTPYCDAAVAKSIVR
jgi:hypothetical protein